MDFCKESDKFISLYIDELLDDKSRIDFLKHIENCSECATKLREASYFTDLCREDQDIPLPDDFSSSLHKRLMKASEKENKSKFISFMHNKKLIASLSTAAVLVISLLAYNLLPQMSINHESSSMANDTAGVYGGNNDNGSQKNENFDQRSVSSDSTATSAQAKTEAVDGDDNVKVMFDKDETAATTHKKEANYSKKDSASTMPSNNESPEEKKTQEEATFGIAGVTKQQYISNYAELNLKVSKGTEIEDLRKFMLGCGATEKKTVTIDSIIGNSSTVDVPVDNSQFSDYELPITLYSTLVTEAKKYNLELTFKTDIIIKDVTSIYNNLNTQKSAVDKKIEEALLKGENTSTLEAEKIRLVDEMKKIVTGQEMITVRIFY